MTIERARVSVPTQLREAGHSVIAMQVANDPGRIDYMVDDERMSLVEAADRFLPGGWAESFGRRG